MKPTKEELEKLVIMDKSAVSKEGIEAICKTIKDWVIYPKAKNYKLVMYVNNDFINLYRNKIKTLDERSKMKYKQHPKN